MNRLYSVEAEATSTGGKADHRVPMRRSEIEAFARDVAGALAGAPPATGKFAAFTAAVARDLDANRGASAVIPGDWQTPEVHALAHRINAALGNVGQTVIHTAPIDFGPADQIASLRDLVSSLDAGRVRLLVMLGGNPVYDAPADFGFPTQLQKARTSVHVTLHRNETAAVSRQMKIFTQLEFCLCSPIYAIVGIAFGARRVLKPDLVGNPGPMVTFAIVAPCFPAGTAAT